jgi:hypothetical protein
MPLIYISCILFGSLDEFIRTWRKRNRRLAMERGLFITFEGSTGSPEKQPDERLKAFLRRKA